MIFKYSRKITKNFAYYTLENVKNFYIFAAEFLNILYMAGKTYSKHPKYYVVWVGRSTGVFGTWDACKEQVDGFEGAKYKSFPDRESAEAAYTDGYNKYLHGGTSFPLSVLLLDDYGVDVALLEEQLAEIRRMESSEMVEYNKLLAPDFRFIDATGTITTEVYGILRGRNLFTHDIAYPRLDMFQTFPLGEDFVVIQSRREILEPETLDFIQENTTEVKKYYAVQGKH